MYPATAKTCAFPTGLGLLVAGLVSGSVGGACIADTLEGVTGCSRVAGMVIAMLGPVLGLPGLLMMALANKPTRAWAGASAKRRFVLIPAVAMCVAGFGASYVGWVLYDSSLVSGYRTAWFTVALLSGGPSMFLVGFSLLTMMFLWDWEPEWKVKEDADKKKEAAAKSAAKGPPEPEPEDEEDEEDEEEDAKGAKGKGKRERWFFCRLFCKGTSRTRRTVGLGILLTAARLPSIL